MASYDSEADTLYMHFKQPNLADDTDLSDQERIIRYENKQVIGLTILNASKRIINIV